MQAISRQRDFFSSGRTRDMSWRRQKIDRLEAVLIERKEEMLAALAEDLGKPPMEAFLAEYHFLLQEIRLVRKNMKKWLRKKRVSSPCYFWPCRSWIERHPFGLVLVMAPWNYPFQLSLSPLIAALAAGNTIILKPSEMAPASERLLATMVDEVFAGEGAEVVTGGVEVAQRLLQEKFDFVFFTGSTAVGREVAARVAPHLTPSLLELGGKCPCVVGADVDLEMTVRRLLSGKFFNAGQTCFAPDFVLVDAEIENRFLECVERVLREVPWDREMATVISERHVQRLLGLCTGEVEVFGEDDLSRRYLAPRLIRSVSWDHPAMQEEIFGPVLPVIRFDDENELLARLGHLESPLAMYCFSNDRGFVERVTRSLASGSVCVNDTMKQFSQLNLPLGGVGASGFGRYRGRYGVEALSYSKSITKRYLMGRDLVELIPPYEKTYRLIKKWFR